MSEVQARQELRARVAAAIGALLKEALPLGPEAGSDANLHGAFADAALGAVEGQAVLVLGARDVEVEKDSLPWPEKFPRPAPEFGFGPMTPSDTEALVEAGERIGRVFVGSILHAQEVQVVGGMAARLYASERSENFEDAAKDAWALFQAVKDATPVPFVADPASH